MRISLVGGGTDFPYWFKSNGGAVVSFAINRYCYLICRNLPPFFNHKSRYVWSQIELVNKTDEIAHPAIKSCLRFFNLNSPRLQIHHDSDIPSTSGLGTSAAFTVGLLNGLQTLQGRHTTRVHLAKQAMVVDHHYTQDVSGCQDYIPCAIGGINLIRFGPEETDFRLDGVKIANIDKLRSNLLLFFTNHSRHSSEVEKTKLKKDNSQALKEQHALVEPCLAALASGDMFELGLAVTESWNLKKSMAENVSSPALDNYIEAGMEAGAYGAKICGAGSGGSLLFVAPPESHQEILEALPSLVYIPFDFDHTGTQVIYNSASDS